MDDVSTWACPACGNRVRLSEGLAELGARPDHDRMDRLAHAVCGCYVLVMPDVGIARLLYALAKEGASPGTLDPDTGSSPKLKA